MNKTKGLSASDILFSDIGPLTPIKAVALFEIAGELAKQGMDKTLVYNGVKYAINNDTESVNDAHKVLEYFKKWASNDKPSVREFIESELAEILESLNTVTITLEEITSDNLSKTTRQNLRKDTRAFKAELERQFNEKFDGDYKKLTKALGITDEYSVKRFFREKRVPKHDTLKAYFKALNVREIKYRIDTKNGR